MTETEIRGNLSPGGFTHLKNYLAKNGRLINTYKRLTVDLSPGFDPIARTWPTGSGRDLRLKKSNSEEKISLKLGEYHDKARQEFDIKLQKGQFLEAVRMFVALGFNSGMVYFWESWEYEYARFEIKISRFNPQYHQWEIESKDDSDPALLAEELHLTPFTPVTFKAAIDWQNQHIHQLFSEEVIQHLLKNF